MYTDWYRLKSLPFRLRPDPAFLYLEGETGRIYGALRAAVTGSCRVVCLEGEAGVGKTTMLAALADSLRASMLVARIQQPNLTAHELMEALATQLGVSVSDQSGQSLQARLMQFVSRRTGSGRTVLVLVDEGHRCSEAVLRSLVELGVSLPALAVVIAGEPELARTLQAMSPRSGSGDLVLTLQMPRLETPQVAGYLDHRLSVAGSEGRRLIDPEALSEIQRYTGGTPKLINMLCDNALVLGETNNLQRIGVVEIRDAVQDLKWVEFPARQQERRSQSRAVAIKEARKMAPGIPQLEVRRDGRPITHLTLSPGRLVIGRSTEAGLRIESPYISREHCHLITTAGQTLVEDLSSTNGIWINGRRHTRRILEPNDMIVIGDHTLIYLEASAGH